MAKPTYGTKLIAVIVIALIGAAAGYGYFTQSAVLSESEAKKTPAVKVEGDTLSPRPADIIIGDVNAATTIVEYMSLSCSHCAHFYLSVLPALQKEFIDTGKVKVIMRHFPLNEPAIKGSMLVECSGQNGLDRKNFLKVLFEMQDKWAFGEDFLKSLKQIALVGGIDSATFDSCNADKNLESGILASRKEGEEKLKIDGTPAFYINGVTYDGPRTVEGFRKALTELQKPQK